MQYILNGALAEIDPKKYENSDTWIQGLTDTCTFEGKQYCVLTTPVPASRSTTRRC